MNTLKKSILYVPYTLSFDDTALTAASSTMDFLNFSDLLCNLKYFSSISSKGMKDVEVNFPLIEDITMEVAKKYGMIQPGESNTKAVRAVFFIDPKGVIRAMIYYPLSTGRNFDELLRTVIALQTADEFSVATPADWRPGDDVIVPTAGSCGVAKKRMTEKGLKCYDWFFCTKKLTKTEIETKLKKK